MDFSMNWVSVIVIHAHVIAMTIPLLRAGLRRSNTMFHILVNLTLWKKAGNGLLHLSVPTITPMLIQE